MVVEAVLLARKHVRESFIAQSWIVVKSLSILVLFCDLIWIRVVNGLLDLLVRIHLEFEVGLLGFIDSIVLDEVESHVCFLGPGIEVEYFVSLINVPELVAQDCIDAEGDYEGKVPG